MDSSSSTKRFDLQQGIDLAKNELACLNQQIDEVLEASPTKQADSLFKATLAGAAGGVSTVLVGHPFDTLKIRAQTSNLGTSTIHLARSIWAQAGILGLYRGASAPLAFAIPSFASYFWGFNIGQQLVRAARQDPSTKSTPLELWEVAIAGGFSAIPATAVMAPCERIKCLLQIQGQRLEKGLQPIYSSAFDCIGQIFRSGGLTSIFRGWEATLLRDVPGSAAWFATYEGLKGYLTPPGQQSAPLSTVLLAGGAAGMAHWTIAIPADVIKSRLQTATEGSVRMGVLECYRNIVAEGGHRALFKGLGPALLRAFPANAVCFVGVELAKDGLSSLGIH